MIRRTFTRLRRLCDALPKSTLDERLASLPAGQRLLAFLVALVAALAVPPLLVAAPGARTALAVALLFGVLDIVARLLLRYDRR